MWGLLAKSRLFITVLPDGVYMNRWEYTKVIEKHFAKWLRGVKKPFLVQDYESCLWCDEPQAALHAIGVEVSDFHPRHSPDLNAIEGVWKLLRERLEATQLAERETREQFVRRLYAARDYVNKHYRSTLRTLSRNQKVRAQDLVDNDGHHIDW